MIASLTNPWNRPLRVGHLTLGLDTGGQEKLLVEFARHADRSRFAPCFISLTTRGPLAEPLENLGCKVVALNAPGGLNPRLVWQLTRTFHNLGVEILHTHDDKPLVYGPLAAKFAGIGTVVHTHHHGQLARVSRRQNLLAQWASRLVDRFVCVSRDSAQFMAGQGVSRHKLLTLPNGIDLSHFANTGPIASGPVVTVARLCREKGLDTLLDAVPAIRALCPTFRLEIAGAGPEREALERQVEELNIQECVQFLGEVRDIPSLLARASLFALPSLTEGISLTLLEAMARGLPVVTTAVGGSPEVVANGYTGLLVPPREPTPLAEAIATLLRDPDLGRRFGQAGRLRAERFFDIRTMVARYEELYLHPHARRLRPNSLQEVTA